MPWLKKLKICHILMLTLAGIVNAVGTAGAYITISEVADVFSNNNAYES